MGSLRCLRKMRRQRKISETSDAQKESEGRCVCVRAYSLGDLQQVVLIAAGVLAILNLFLPSLQNRSVGLGVGRVRETGVAATVRGSARSSLI